MEKWRWNAGLPQGQINIGKVNVVFWASSCTSSRRDSLCDSFWSSISPRHLAEALEPRRLALPLSELSGDDGGLADSCVCKFSISAFLVSRSCWRLLISACWSSTVRKSHRVGLAALQTCTRCTPQKAMFNETHICVCVCVHLSSPESTAHTSNNCVWSNEVSAEGFVLKFEEFERDNTWQ